MGRMLETLKRADPQQTPRPEVAAAPAEEVPFIEWGPRKSMEASPSVLAAPGPGEPVRRTSRIPDETTVALVAPPQGVAFRAAPSAKTGAQLAPELIAFHDPEHAVSVQYRELLKALLAVRPADRPQALLFTAAHAGDSTTTVLNAAITAARLGRRRVAVVDANTAAPALAPALGLAEKPGWREVLAGAATLDEALRPTEQPDLAALTAGVTAAAGGVRFLAETVRSLLRQLRQRFDLVFVNAPPWDDRPETASLFAACDAVYVVVTPAEADAPATDDLFRRVSETGATLGGCIVTTG